MFNPQPHVQAVPLFDGHRALVVDDVLTDPQPWLQSAVAQQARFEPSLHAYPGLELWLADAALAPLMDFFGQHIRARLGGRRTLQGSARLSLVTLAPQQLIARQWLCHRDSGPLPPDECLIAGVIYLFEDPALGGTSFYRPRRPAAATNALVQDSQVLDDAAFLQRYPEVQPGYMGAGNAWFERMATVPARFNRAVFYDGALYHSGDVGPPERMVADPARGRLTVNAFVRCRRQAV